MLHLLHHLLHPDGLPLILSMDLLFDMLLHIHIIQSADNLAHVLKVVHCLPELFELVVLYQLLSLVKVENERFQLILVDPFVVSKFVLEVAGDFSAVKIK